MGAGPVRYPPDARLQILPLGQWESGLDITAKPLNEAEGEKVAKIWTKIPPETLEFQL